MMERKIGQIAMGIMILITSLTLWLGAPYLSCILLVTDLVPSLSQLANSYRRDRFSAVRNCQIAVPLMVARFINRDVCPPSLKNTAIALMLDISYAHAAGGCTA